MESREKRWVATSLLAAGLFVIGGMGGAAQDATPAGGSGHAHRRTSTSARAMRSIPIQPSHRCRPRT